LLRSELLLALAKINPGLRDEEIESFVDIFFDEIAEHLAEEGRVELRGFGTFSTRQRVARKGRNPRTGGAVQVPGKRVPFFKPGKEIRERVASTSHVQLARLARPKLLDEVEADSLPFGSWLLKQQQHRREWIADLAKAAKSSHRFPKAGSVDQVREYLENHSVDGVAFEALDDAEGEWLGL
jgi:integration host factor subunit beta